MWHVRSWLLVALSLLVLAITSLAGYVPGSAFASDQSSPLLDLGATALPAWGLAVQPTLTTVPTQKTVTQTRSVPRTSTPTQASSPSKTATATRSSTPTRTVTTTKTPTATSTVTVYRSPTATPTVSKTPTSTVTRTPTPSAPAQGSIAFTALAAGDTHTCGLSTGGTVHCWGLDTNGQLGDGTNVGYRTAPVAVSDGMTFTALAAGKGHTCALAAGGGAYCWGSNGYGQVGDGAGGNGVTLADRTGPVGVSGGITFTALMAGDFHTCGLAKGGRAYCWGANWAGQLGDGTAGTDRTSPVAVSGGRTFTALAAGGGHTCGLARGGTAYCWGYNGYGQLGDGTRGVNEDGSADRMAPVEVNGGRTFTALAAGSNHSCGLATGGTGYCWGANMVGQLGDGMSGNGSSSADRTIPVAVGGARTFTALTAGGGHSCGLAAGGTAYYWGWNGYGQLGDGTSGVDGDRTSDRAIPVAVGGGRSFKGLVAGGYQTCGVVAGGTAYCWGFNVFGQLGDGTRLQQIAPVAVSPNRSFTVLGAGRSHTCGLAQDGSASCWGLNTYGQLGVGTLFDGWGPRAVSGGRSYMALVAGANHTCGLATGGKAYCWGDSRYGQLGEGLSSGLLAPVEVNGGRKFTALAAGTNHTCALAAGGKVYCWGDNGYGQLGDGTVVTNRSGPVAVSGGRTFTALATGDAHTCGLATGGKAYCWGDNRYGQLGNGTRVQQVVPVAVGGGRTFKALAAGASHTCGLVAGGTAYCWGGNEYGQLGDGTGGGGYGNNSADRTAPVTVSGARTFTALVAGASHTCGLATGGTAYCWGYNGNGQIGDGTLVQQTAPAPVSGARAFRALVAGGSHTCGLAPGGTAYCWGSNASGQLGDDTSGTDRTTPVAVTRRCYAAYCW